MTATTTAPSPTNRAAPRLGDSVMVKTPADTALRNTESGGFFAPDTPTLQTVTVTTLARLRDGCLVLC